MTSHLQWTVDRGLNPYPQVLHVYPICFLRFGHSSESDWKERPMATVDAVTPTQLFDRWMWIGSSRPERCSRLPFILTRPSDGSRKA